MSSIMPWQKIQPPFTNKILIWGIMTEWGCYRVDVVRCDKDRTFNQFRLSVFLDINKDEFTKTGYVYSFKHNKYVYMFMEPMNQGEILAEYVFNKKKMATKNKRLREQVHRGCTVKWLLENYGHPNSCTPGKTKPPNMSKLNLDVIEARLIVHNDGNDMDMVIETSNYFFIISYAGS
jgi:hypothetical protein